MSNIYTFVVKAALSFDVIAATEAQARASIALDLGYDAEELRHKIEGAYIAIDQKDTPVLDSVVCLDHPSVNLKAGGGCPECAADCPTGEPDAL